MKTYLKCCALLVATLLLPLLFNCKKDTPKVEPSVTLTNPTNITAISASAGGFVTSDGGDPVTSRGVCWSSTNATPTTSDSKTSDGTGTGSFASSLTGLTQGTTYNIRAYATNSIGTGYSSASTFKTLALAPTVTTTDLSAITATSFNSGGNITNDGGASITARGVCWSTNQNPTLTDSKTSDGTGTGSFTSSVLGLSPGTIYYVRAYSTNSIGTSYGNQITTKTSTVLPTITTTSVTSITSTSATSGGNITSDGGGAITARGVCWSTSQNPTITDSKTADGTGTGNFTSSITGLTPGSIYYIRAYATNSIGTAYGIQVTTTTSAILPTITTTALSAITSSTAISGGNISNDGSAPITARGVCWSTTPNPTTSNSKTSDNTGTGSFTSSLTGLIAGTTYYLRAYSINSAGTAYGNEITFSSSANLPTITTAAISNITSTTASSGGNITSDGGGAITARGVCWSTTPSATTERIKTIDASGTGVFTSSITGLTANTTYYVRAYATNSGGTAYGNEIIFMTKGIPPTVYTNIPVGISSFVIACGGYIPNEGGAPVTARGVCWSTTPNPTISNFKTIDGTGIYSFASCLTGLNPNTTYYVRAYATNSIGTTYGKEVVATTIAIQPISKKFLALISVVNSWVNYENNSWERVYPVKENDNIQIFQVCIWNIPNPKVSLYRFDRTFDPISVFNLGGKAWVDYRENFNILNVDIPIKSSQAYLNAFKLIIEKIVKIQPFEHLGIDYKGHGTGGSGLFENKISGADSEILLSHINSLTGKKIDYLDWNTNCEQGNFERILAEYKYADYILGSDLNRGGFGFDVDVYFKLDPGEIYETFFLPSKSIKQCLVDMINSERLFWESSAKSKNEMISNKVKQSISIYDSNKFEDLVNSTNLKSSTYSGDVLDYVRKYYPAQEQKFMDFRFYYVSNKDFFKWDIDSNGFVK